MPGTGSQDFSRFADSSGAAGQTERRQLRRLRKMPILRGYMASLRAAPLCTLFFAKYNFGISFIIVVFRAW